MDDVEEAVKKLQKLWDLIPVAPDEEEPSSDKKNKPGKDDEAKEEEAEKMETEVPSLDEVMQQAAQLLGKAPRWISEPNPLEPSTNVVIKPLASRDPKQQA
ncbi:unnamed protein product [Calypogeia fissa]